MAWPTTPQRFGTSCTATSSSVRCETPVHLPHSLVSHSEYSSPQTRSVYTATALHAPIIWDSA
eukprot:m.302708 g.302708  ORF g.302708 m.302708 type:complete len:63 (+) comp16312_c1_seq5:3153-3341(+)